MPVMIDAAVDQNDFVIEAELDGKVEWVAPHGTPGVIAVQVLTPSGMVRI